MLAMILQIKGDKISIKVEGNKLKRAHITGPRHNFLSLVLDQDRLNFNFALTDLNVDSKNINLSEKK